MRPTPSLLLALCASLACTPTETPNSSAPTLTPLSSPAGPRSAEPFLHVDTRGRVHMTWLERTGDSAAAVRYARLDGDTWSIPSTIVRRKDLFVNWADFPAVVTTESGALVAHWLQRSGEGKYAYDIRIARSPDAGATWTDGVVLHRDGKAAEHGFLAFWAGSGDSTHAAWLDGRNMVGGHGNTRGAMTVHHTSIASNGSLGTETALDLRTCECCQVNAAVGSAGPIVVYRDRSEGEIRDIGVVRFVNGAWTTPSIVYADNWHVEGCPVNGPAVAARGDTAVVAWFTGAGDTARVRVAWSVDGGASFGAPTRIDGGEPVGRVDVELLADGTAAVSWLERVPPQTGEVRIRRVGRDGTSGTAFTVAATSAARPSGFPKMVLRGKDLIAAWTVPGDTSYVRLGRFSAHELK